MSQYTQYADHNFYFSHSLTGGKPDTNGYNEHRTLDRDIISDVCLEGHKHADEILAMMKDVYRPEDLPSNGSTEGYIKGKLTHCADTRDLAEQAKNPPSMWSSMMLAYQVNIRKIARWTKGFNPDTLADIRFQKKLSKTKAQMKASPVYRVKLEKRWQLLKMCNKALA